MITREEYIELHTESLLSDWKVTAQIVREVVAEDVKEMSDKEFKELIIDYGYEEQGTVYTGDAPSTEASFYKRSEEEDLDNQAYSEGEDGEQTNQ